MNYTRADVKKMSSNRLLAALKRGKKDWASLPRRSSFGGIHVSGQLNIIQQELQRRGVNFQPIYTEINMLG